MNKEYKFIIFDWDGTLMDSVGKIVQSMQRAAADVNLPVPTRKDVEHIIGISLAPAIGRLFNLHDDKAIDTIVARYKHHFLHADTIPCALFPGVDDLLQALQNTDTTLAVATGKARRGLTRAWQQTNTGHYFDFSRCADESESKPSSDMLQQLLDESGFDVSQSVMIGDTTYDMQMAQTIGMDRIGVNYGVHHPDELKAYSPLFQAKSVSALQAFLMPRSHINKA